MDSPNSQRRNGLGTALGTALGWSLGWSLLLAACAPEAPAPQPGAPAAAKKPTIKTLYHDYGMIDLGTAKTHEFEIPVPKNDYGEVIVDDTFRGDCSCAVGLIMLIAKDGTSKAVFGLPPDQRVVRDGERVVLRLKLTTKDKEPVQVPRTESRGSVSFELRSDQYARYETVRIRFHYGITTPIQVSPVAHVDFGQLPLCQRFERTLTLRSTDPERPLTLGAVKARPNLIEARLEPSGAETLLHIKVFPNPESPRAFRGEVVMPTGLENYPELRILVSGTFVGDIEYMPSETVSFALFDFSQPKQRFVNLQDHNLERSPDFALRSIKTTDGVDIREHFDVTFKPLSGRRRRVTIRYLGTLKGTRLNGWVSLGKTADGEEIARIKLIGFNARR